MPADPVHTAKKKLEAADLADRVMGTPTGAGETTIDRFTTQQVVALFEALVRSGVRVRMELEIEP